MSPHPTPRVPVDPSYAALVGTAVYVFAYYEWAIIYIIDSLKPGFVHRYSRVSRMTSGQVKDELKKVIDNPATDFTKVNKTELQSCYDQFERLIDKRNALIHAHPCTDTDGRQLLAYQAKPGPNKPLPDMKWPEHEVNEIVSEFDAAACSAVDLLHKLL